MKIEVTHCETCGALRSETTVRVEMTFTEPVEGEDVAEFVASLKNAIASRGDVASPAVNVFVDGAKQSVKTELDIAVASSKAAIDRHMPV